MASSDADASLESIIARARRGDPGAVEALIEQYWPQAYRIAYSVVRDHQQAEDVAQEGCARVVAGLRSLRSHRAFASWARRIVVNTACSCVRTSWRQLPAVPLSSRLETPADDSGTERLNFEATTDRLQPIYRVPLVLHYVHGYSSAEIGKMLDLPAATVRSRLKVARDRLRQHLLEEEQHVTAKVRLPIARKGAH